MVLPGNGILKNYFLIFTEPTRESEVKLAFELLMPIYLAGEPVGSSDVSWWYLLVVPVVAAFLVGLPFCLSYATWALLRRIQPQYQDEVIKSILLGCALTLVGTLSVQQMLGEAWFYPSMVLLPILGSITRYLTVRRFSQ